MGCYDLHFYQTNVRFQDRKKTGVREQLFRKFFTEEISFQWSLKEILWEQLEKERIGRPQRIFKTVKILYILL